MSIIIVQDIIDGARNVYLNDTGAVLYTNARLLPYVKMASDFMETNLEENNISCKNETEVGIKVVAGKDELLPLPPDFVWPIALKERGWGSSDLFSDMNQRPWEPEISPSDRLIYWTWRTDRIKLLPATTDREVKLYYQCSFPIINVVNDSVYGYAKQYLIAKVGAMAHLFISQNTTAAEIANKQAEKNMDQVVNIQAKKSQATPTRRRPYTPFR